MQTSYDFQPPIGFAGTLDYKRPHSDLTVRNAETAVSIPWGAAVKRKAAATSDLDVTFPSAEADRILGIVIREQTYARVWTDQDGNKVGQLDGNGLVPGTLMAIATMGRMLVQCVTGCKAGDGLWVRAVAGPGEELGSLANADDGTDMVDCTSQGRWQTSTTPGGLAWLEFDFTNI
ncbi:MAG: structural cement protein Gp24 [Kofleriaceae bacterium]